MMEVVVSSIYNWLWTALLQSSCRFSYGIDWQHDTPVTARPDLFKNLD